MKLLLMKPVPGGSYVSQIIASVCGPYCHAEIQLDDGRFFSSDMPSGVRFLSKEEGEIKLATHPAYWDFIDLPWSITPEVIAWCESEVGSGYDYQGAIASGFGLATENPERWFCSEICAEIISRVSGLSIPRLLCPSALGEWMDGVLEGYEREILANTEANNCFNRICRRVCFSTDQSEELRSLISGLIHN